MFGSLQVREKGERTPRGAAVLDCDVTGRWYFAPVVKFQSFGVMNHNTIERARNWGSELYCTTSAPLLGYRVRLVSCQPVAGGLFVIFYS